MQISLDVLSCLNMSEDVACCSRLVTHDEGSCWVPAEIRDSIILSHWGRKVSLARSKVAAAADLHRAE